MDFLKSIVNLIYGSESAVNLDNDNENENDRGPATPELECERSDCLYDDIKYAGFLGYNNYVKLKKNLPYVQKLYTKMQAYALTTNVRYIPYEERLKYMNMEFISKYNYDKLGKKHMFSETLGSNMDQNAGSVKPFFMNYDSRPWMKKETLKRAHSYVHLSQIAETREKNEATPRSINNFIKPLPSIRHMTRRPSYSE